MNDGVGHTRGSAEILFLRSLTIRQSDLQAPLGTKRQRISTDWNGAKRWNGWNDLNGLRFVSL